LLLLATVAIWGSTFVIVKDALRDASPLVFNLIRMTLATVALAILNRRQLRGISRAQLLKGMAVGGLLAAGYSLQTLGLARTTAAKSGLLTGLVVVFVPLLTIVPGLRPAGTARPGVFTAVGAVLAFAGLILLTTPPGVALAHLFASIGGSPGNGADRRSHGGDAGRSTAGSGTASALDSAAGRRAGDYQSARDRRRVYHPELRPAASATRDHRGHPNA
jgi:drug/metabolite transporter (DMT)-like permease